MKINLRNIIWIVIFLIGPTLVFWNTQLFTVDWYRMVAGMIIVVVSVHELWD